MPEVTLVPDLHMDDIGTLRDFAVAEAILHIEDGRNAPSRALMLDPEGRVYATDLDALPREERSPHALRQILRSFRSVAIPAGFALVLPAAADKGRTPGFCIVTHDGLEAHSEGFILRNGKMQAVKAPASITQSGIITELNSAWMTA